MRIRQIRPEFWTDPIVASLPVDVRLTFIGLWNAADDAGYLVWDVSQVGALLYPYESVLVRERRIRKAGEWLTEKSRLAIFDCGCALIPRLIDHQKIGGNKSFTARDKHRVHTVPDLSARNVRLGNGTVGNVADARDPGAASAFKDGLAAAGLKPEIAGRTA